MKRLVKDLLGRAVSRPALHDLLLKRAAVVVAFHRVQDAAEPDDGLTTTTDMFERYCRFFARRFRVVSLTALVSKLERGLAPDRDLAITFDDGYRDNVERAAPVLIRLRLPATFFVVTRWMSTDVVPWWDAARNVAHSWMTWDHVRWLHRQGFEVGAHTRTHADLGRVSGPAAREEIAGARLELEERLGAPVQLFAYPYGRRGNLTEANRELVRAAGFRCCCGGYGGVNGPDADPFDLRRIPISPWYRSPHHFGFELVRGATLTDEPEPAPAPHGRLLAR